MKEWKPSVIFIAVLLVQVFSWVTPKPWYQDVLPIIAAGVAAIAWGTIPGREDD